MGANKLAKIHFLYSYTSLRVLNSYFVHGICFPNSSYISFILGNPFYCYKCKTLYMDVYA